MQPRGQHQLPITSPWDSTNQGEVNPDLGRLDDRHTGAQSATKVAGFSQALFSKLETSPRNESAGLSILWLTWSQKVRSVLWQWAEVSRTLEPPSIKRFGYGEYTFSISQDLPEPTDPVLKQDLEAAADAFLHFPRFEGMIGLDRLMDDQINGNVLRSFFSVLRSMIASTTGDELAAIYAPLGATGASRQGEFPLHSDLYPPVYLLNVFDNVPSDHSGASIFLPMSVGLQVFEESALVPIEIKHRFRELVSTPSNTDRYRELYDLLHGDHPWRSETEAKMTSGQLRVSFESGQGYLVHDRLWLHGREAPIGGVPKNRLHRFVFDNAESLRNRATESGRGKNLGVHP